MAVLALAVIPAMLLDDGASTPTVHAVATGVNWFVWVAFCAEFGVRWAVSRDRQAFLRKSWFDLALIAASPPFGVPEAMQGFRAVRAVRMLRMLRLLRAAGVLAIGLRTVRRVLGHRRFHHVLILASGVMLLGAAALYFLEQGHNDGVRSFADALWWAVTTTTTVGYGDVYPKTGAGRIIAVVLMLVGIGLIGVFTATIASFFVAGDEKSELDEVRQQLRVVEAKLDQLLVRPAVGRDDDSPPVPYDRGPGAGPTPS
jgi:voltage-gated potassium channel